MKHNPSIHDFIERLKEYRKVNILRSHLTRSTWFLRREDKRPIEDILKDYMNSAGGVYLFEELNILEQDLSEYIDKKISLGHQNTSPRKKKGLAKVEDLSNQEIEFLKDWYQKDYELLETVEKLRI